MIEMKVSNNLVHYKDLESENAKRSLKGYRLIKLPLIWGFQDRNLHPKKKLVIFLN